MLEALPLIMFGALAGLLMLGFPVAFVLGGVAFLFWSAAVLFAGENPASFFLVVSRIFGGVVAKEVLVAIPMFILMGTLMERSGTARGLLLALQGLTGRIPGGLALAVTVLGVILAATTGIIGASVVMMTLLALPVLLERGYDPSLASGTIAAAGTLGILLPPSIMLVVMADLLAISTGALFKAAILPGLGLAALYAVYIMTRALFQPALAPASSASPADRVAGGPPSVRAVLFALIPPALLIASVLGSIFTGVATPTEASGVGAFGALLLAVLSKGFDFKALRDCLQSSADTTTMIFTLFVGATAFSYVFALYGGHDLLTSAIEAANLGPWGLLACLMAAVFLMGFFFDWIEITLIILPLFAPIIADLDFQGHVEAGKATVIWFALLMAVNLQTSFLTPPFGFALFYMKGAAGGQIGLANIYRGIAPFILLQLLGLGLLIAWPALALQFLGE